MSLLVIVFCLHRVSSLLYFFRICLNQINAGKKKIYIFFVQKKHYFHSHIGGFLRFLPSSCSPPRNQVARESERGLVNTFSGCCQCVFSLEGMPRGGFSMGRASVNKRYNGSPLLDSCRWHTLKSVECVCVCLFWHSLLFHPIL